MNRLSACREFCGVHNWQNGTRCRDGVKVLWCHSHLVWLVFEGFIPIHALVFLQKTFWDLLPSEIVHHTSFLWGWFKAYKSLLTSCGLLLGSLKNSL